MIKINVITNNFNWYRFIKIPNNYIERKIKKLNFKNKNYKKNIIFCTLLLSNTKAIKKLNSKFRKKNKSTDVLSFPFYNKKNLKKKIKNEKEIYLGDIIINLNKIIKKHEKKYETKSKFDKLWIHGLIHLLGGRHKSNKDFFIMKNLEDKFFRSIN